MQDLTKLFQGFSSLRAGVIGDVMLDHYHWGRVDRISPEAPVPVVMLEKEEWRIGGAGNVALNLQSLGIKTSLLSVIGSDNTGTELLRLCDQAGIDTTNVSQSPSRTTTRKTRIISRNQQMMRLDLEQTLDLAIVDEDELVRSVEKFVKEQKPQIMIFEDYNKGVLTARVIRDVINICKRSGVLTAVDPKWANFFEYQNVCLFKPNLKEIKEALNLPFLSTSMASLKQVHMQLHETLHHELSFITLSEKGVFYQDASLAGIIPSHFRKIADVSGAGDTVIAVAAAVYVISRNPYLMAEIANIAGGLVCETVGTAVINKEILFHECELLLS